MTSCAPASASTSIFTPVRLVRRRRHPPRLRRLHLLPQRSGARHRDALPPQDAAARRRRDEHRLLRSIPLGAICALRPGRLLDKTLVTFSLIGLASPQFFIGQVILLITSVRFSLVQFGDGPWTHLIFPAITLALPAIGRLTMVVRSAMIDELNSQYVKAAKAKGVSRYADRRRARPAQRGDPVRHPVRLGGDPRAGRVHRSSSRPSSTGLDWAALAILAINQRDFYLIQTIVFVVAVMVVFVNIAIDVTYKFIDPRVKLT